MKVIKEFKGKYWFLSNFYPIYFLMDGIEYPSVEHAFQASKSTSMKTRKFMAEIKDCHSVKAAGRSVDPLRKDWERVKESIMYQCLLLKFTASQTLLQSLVETGDAVLKEGNNWGDTYWGVDIGTGKGRNKLGIALMEVRSLFR